MSGAGNDTLDGGSGSDVMVGGAGNGTYMVDTALNPESVGDSIVELAGAGTVHDRQLGRLYAGRRMSRI